MIVFATFAHDVNEYFHKGIETCFYDRSRVLVFAAQNSNFELLSLTGLQQHFFRERYNVMLSMCIITNLLQSWYTI